MKDTNVDIAERDIREGQLSLEGVAGLVDNFRCYVVTDSRYNPATTDTKAIYNWCEQNFGEHKVAFLFIPNGIIEKERDYWFLAEKKYATLFNLKWPTTEQRP